MSRTLHISFVLSALLGPSSLLAEKAQSELPARIEVLGIELKKVEPGRFSMGIQGLDKRVEPFEGVRAVEITKPFYLGVHEVSQASWERVMEKNPSHFKSRKHPVENVSWKESMAYCKALNSRLEDFSKVPEGMRFRLPSEAEWEYAARAGTKSIYFFGDKSVSIGDFAWISANSRNGHQPVKTKKPNPWGFYDVYGNVREWCLDGYEARPRRKLVDPVIG
ncbi:MAG TPA: hypothetical protein DCG39_05600, partial [Opitutae bacterium]|nr:hypothetical protein [Opitutae bacterium]